MKTVEESVGLTSGVCKKCIEDTKAAVAGEKSVDRIPSVQDLYSDPVEQIEHLYGSKDRKIVHISSPGWLEDWNERRLKIATDPRYMDRARESYAFQDLIGQEYNGVVFE